MRRNDKPKNIKETFKRLTSYLRPHLVRLIIVLFAAILSTVFAILGQIGRAHV